MSRIMLVPTPILEDAQAFFDRKLENVVLVLCVCVGLAVAIVSETRLLPPKLGAGGWCMWNKKKC